MKLNMNIILIMIISLFVVKCETWWGEVSGHNIYDGKNGYAGSSGKAITAFYLCGNRRYRVHYKGDSKDNWTGEYWNCEPVGIGRTIDGISISGGYQYRVRYKNGNWEVPVSGYNIYDARNGFAGTYEREIDAILVDGNEIYRAAYGVDSSSNVEQVARRVVKNLFGIDAYYSFDYETTIIDNYYSKVTVKLEHEFNWKSDSKMSLVIKNNVPTDVNLGNFGNILEELKKVINFNINDLQAKIKYSFANGMSNGSVNIIIYLLQRKIELYAGSKITADHHSYRGGYKITIYFHDHINELGEKLLSPCYVFLRKLGPVGETAMATIRGLVRDVIQIISKSLEYLNRYLPSIVAQFIPFIILLLINLVGAF